MLTIDRSYTSAAPRPSSSPKTPCSEVKLGQAFRATWGGPFLAVGPGRSDHIPAFGIWNNNYYPNVVSTGGVTLLDLETLEPIAPQIKMRKVTARDVKPGDVFAWSAFDLSVIARCTRIDGVEVYGVSLDEGDRHEEQHFCDTDSRAIKALYPEAHFELGDAVIDVDGGETTEVVTKPARELVKGDVYMSTYQPEAILLAESDCSADRHWDMDVLVLKGNNTLLTGTRDELCSRSDSIVTVLDRQTLQPLIRRVPSKRGVTGADIKPGMIASWYLRSGFEGTPFLCTRVEGGTVWGVPIRGSGTTEVRETSTSSERIKLYPNAKLILGAPVTEVEDK